MPFDLLEDDPFAMPDYSRRRRRKLTEDQQMLAEPVDPGFLSSLGQTALS